MIRLAPINSGTTRLRHTARVNATSTVVRIETTTLGNVTGVHIQRTVPNHVGKATVHGNEMGHEIINPHILGTTNGKIFGGIHVYQRHVSGEMSPDTTGTNNVTGSHFPLNHVSIDATIPGKRITDDNSPDRAQVIDATILSTTGTHNVIGRK